MDKCLVLDTSVGSANKGDNIIMECFRKELSIILTKYFVYNLPTHVASFHWYQVMRNSLALQRYANCKLKFVGGTNLLVKSLLTHYPQWNINLFNCRPFVGVILVGVGAGSGDNSNWYTKHLYKRILSDSYIHSVRDERSREFVESLGKKAINTGCVTMWMFTPDFCKKIPIHKANSVIFTLTPHIGDEDKDRFFIDSLCQMYNCVYLWIQGDNDYAWFKHLDVSSNIEIVNPTIEAYHNLLNTHDLDYVGTRLHAGIYAMRHGKRTLILAIDERARGISKSNNINCIDKDDYQYIPDILSGEIVTDIRMPHEKIKTWKNQFVN